MAKKKEQKLSGKEAKEKVGLTFYNWRKAFGERIYMVLQNIVWQAVLCKQ